MTTTLIPENLADDQKKYKPYYEAINNLSKMLPQLTSYARTITGNKKISVRVGYDMSATDGKVIYIRPPLSLAGKRKHQLSKCDTYDEIGRSLCSWCRTREELMVILQHEIGHIVGGSFKKLTNRDFTSLLEALKDNDFESEYRASVLGVRNSNPDLSMISLISAMNYPQVQYLSLMTEDIRCNEGVFQRSPIELEKFKTRDLAYLTEGVQDNDGSYKKYIDLNIDTQLVIATYMKAFGYELNPDEYIAKEVCELVNTAKVTDLADRIRYSADVVDCAKYTLELAKIFRKAGHFVPPEKSDLSEDEIREFLEELAKILGLMMGHGTELLGHDCSDGDAHAGQGMGGGDDPEAFKGEKIDGHSGKLLSDEEMKKVCSSLWVLDRTPVNVEAPVIYPSGRKQFARDNESYDYDTYDHLKPEEFKVPESALGKSVSRARLLFEENKRVERHRNQKSGRVTGRVLARRVPFDDNRVFETKLKPDARDYAVVIGIDVSGSTSGERIKLAKQAAYGQAEVCARTGVKFAIFAHSTEYTDSGWGRVAPAIWTVKGFDDPWTAKLKDNLRTLQSVSGNLDGHSMQFYRKQLDAVTATDKILLYYTDGAMPATNYEEELRVLKDEIKLCQKRGYTLLGVGIQTNSPKAHGLDTVQVNGPNDILAVVEHLGKRLRGVK